MTTGTLHRTPPDHASSHLRSTVRALAHEVSARAGEAERAGTMPVDLVDRFRRRGVVPRPAARGAGRFRARAAGVRGADRGAERGRRLDRLDGHHRCRWIGVRGVVGARGGAADLRARRRLHVGDGVRAHRSARARRSSRVLGVGTLAVCERLPTRRVVRHGRLRPRRRRPEDGPRARARLAPGVVPRGGRRGRRPLGRDGVARHRQQRRRRPVRAGGGGADDQPVLRAGAPRRSAVALAVLHPRGHRVGRRATRHRSPRARRAGRARTHQGPGRHRGADRPRHRRARRHGPRRGTVAGGEGVRVRRDRLTVGDRPPRRRPVDHPTGEPPVGGAGGHARRAGRGRHRARAQWCERHPVGPRTPALFPRCPHRQPTRGTSRASRSNAAHGSGWGWRSLRSCCSEPDPPTTGVP